MTIWDGWKIVQSSEPDIIRNKKEGLIYVADFQNKEGKYISAVFDEKTEPYDIQLKISPRIELRITYIASHDQIEGIKITKVYGKKNETIHLSTLGFEGVLSLLHVFSGLDLKSLANGSLILDSSVVSDKDALRRHLNTILADEEGSKILAEVAASTTVSSGTTFDILKFLSGLSADEKTKKLVSILPTIDVANLSAAHKQQTFQTEIKNLTELLNLEEQGDIVESIKGKLNLQAYQAGQPEKIFQKWIENNLWVFGTEYIRKLDATKIAIFSDSDLLMESMDGFLDLIELKRPKLTKYTIFNYDPNHKSYYPSPDLSAVIGQCLFYLQKMDEYKLNLEKEYKARIIRPRVKIILGRTNEFNPEQYEALRMLNSNLNHIQIISYDYLVSCANKMILNYQ